jgi:hypothetical protein
MPDEPESAPTSEPAPPAPAAAESGPAEPVAGSQPQAFNTEPSARKEMPTSFVTEEVAKAEHDD